MIEVEVETSTLVCTSFFHLKVFHVDFQQLTSNPFRQFIMHEADARCWARGWITAKVENFERADSHEWDIRDDVNTFHAY